MNKQRVFVGLDVGKDSVDYAIRPVGERGIVPRTPQGMQRLIKALAPFEVVEVVLEPTAGYERLVLDALFAAGLPLKLVPASRARSFARSLGRLAKTDAIDAAVLAHMAEVAVGDLRCWEPRSPTQEEVRTLVQRRDALVASIEAERNRLESATAPAVAKSYKRAIRFFDKEKAVIEARLAELVPQEPELARRVEVLESVKGVGRIVALTLLTEVPELGTLTRREAAALVGVAPYNNDSGRKQGKRFIRGGRSKARRVLFMATLVGLRHNPVIKAHYAHLRARGKEGKVAVVACMRKLLIHLNSLLRLDPHTSPMPAG